MKIKKNLFSKAFIIANIFAIIGALLKINHLANSSLILVIVLFFTLLYVIIGIIEVNDSEKIQSSEKTLWTIGFIFFNFFVGLYYLAKRKNIV